MQLVHRYTAALAATCTLAIAIGGSIGSAHAVPQPEVDTVTVADGDSTLTVTLDSAVTVEESEKIQKELAVDLQPEVDQEPVANNQEPGKAVVMAPDKGPKYRVIKCSTSNTVISDRNGRFDVRYNCGSSNVNWGYRVSSKLVAIATGNMKESGVAWYKGTRKIGQNSPHNVPVSYFLHGTQGSVASGDTLSWHDTMVFRVNAGGKTGTAKLNVGGTFVVLR
jgi:hypothetical protein